MKLLWIIPLLFLVGCETIYVEVPAPKQWNCTYDGPDEHWWCKAVSADKCLESFYVPCSEVPQSLK